MVAVSRKVVRNKDGKNMSMMAFTGPGNMFGLQLVGNGVIKMLKT